MDPTARTGLVAWLVAAVGGVALVAAAVLVPMYGSDSTSGSDPRTLVDVNGPAVLAVAGLPLLVTLAVGAALRGRARPLAWALTGLLAAVNLLALLSIGVFILPITAALVVACAAGGPARPQPVPA